jgi:NodT family efflux transporter outer membrane factor (OMF) lipoprotein
MAIGARAAVAARFAVPLVAGSLLAGCMVGPDFTPPVAATKPHWVETAIAEHARYSGVSEQRQPAVEWWRKLNDPVLDELVALAYRQNLTLEMAGIRIYQARAQLGIVIGDKFPQTQRAGIGFKSERVSKEVGLLKEVATLIDFDPVFNDWSAGFDASWEIDVWGQVRRGIQAAGANLVAQIADYDDVLITVTGDVATAYVTIRELQELLTLARSNVALQTESLDITEARFNGGVTTELDVQEATVLLNNTRAQIPSLEADLAKAKNALAVLLGMPAGAIDAVVNRPGPVPRPPAEIGVGIPSDLLRRRPDIRAAEMRAARQAAMVGVATADLYPQFGITGAIGFKASDFSDLFTGKALTSLINPGVTWNLLNYGRIKNNVRVQDAKYQEAITSYQQTVLKAYADVEDALTAFLMAKQEAVYLSRAVEASQMARRIALAQYEDGAADYTRVLNAETNLLHSQQGLAAVRADVVTNLIALYKGLGGGWQPANAGPYIPEATKTEMALRTNWGTLLDEQAPSHGERVVHAPPPAEVDYAWVLRDGH